MLRRLFCGKTLYRSDWGKVLMSSNGFVINSSIDGSIQMKFWAQRFHKFQWVSCVMQHENFKRKGIGRCLSLFVCGFPETIWNYLLISGNYLLISGNNLLIWGNYLLFVFHLKNTIYIIWIFWSFRGSLILPDTVCNKYRIEVATLHWFDFPSGKKI